MMSDRDTAPDPIDKAYRLADALVADEPARAARRARVLGAVARAPEQGMTAAPAPSRTPVGRYVWRGSGALMAASVAGLALLATLQQRQPGADRPAPAAPRADASRGGARDAPLEPLKPEAPASAPDASAAVRQPSAGIIGAPVRRSPPPAAPPMPRRGGPAWKADTLRIPPLAVPPVQQRIEVPDLPSAIPPLPVPPVQRRMEVLPLPAPPVVSAPGPRAFPLGESSAGEGRAAATGARRAQDPVVRLGAAASEGDVVEVRDLLGQGVPVDAADAAGETALMKAIRAGQHAMAALLRARGANLDRKNHTGQTARELAVEKDDPRIDAALGLDR
jgi:hypothetical protein